MKDKEPKVTVIKCRAANEVLKEPAEVLVTLTPEYPNFTRMLLGAPYYRRTVTCPHLQVYVIGICRATGALCVHC